jgi:hypothetical protein
MADVIGGHDEGAALRNGSREDHLHLAGEGKEEAAAGDHHPVEGGLKEADGEGSAGMLSGSDGRHWLKGLKKVEELQVTIGGVGFQLVVTILTFQQF